MLAEVKLVNASRSPPSPSLSASAPDKLPLSFPTSHITTKPPKSQVPSSQKKFASQAIEDNVRAVRVLSNAAVVNPHWDFSCVARIERDPWEPRYKPARDDKKIEPGWLRYVVEILVNTACSRLLSDTRDRCYPKLVRNDEIDGAAFYWEQDTIRYDWRYLTKYGKKATGYNDDKFYDFVLGIMAHEYGHYLDDVSRLVLSNKLNSTPEFAGFKLNARQIAEAWSDYAAGCVLSQTQFDWRPTEAFFGIANIANEDYPSTEIRVDAFRRGWWHCKDAEPPNSVLDELIRQFESVARRLTRSPSLIPQIDADAGSSSTPGIPLIPTIPSPTGP